MPFPQFWPRFTPKGKLADWFELYASVLELNVWTSVQLQSLSYNNGKKQWTIQLEREIDGRKENRKRQGPDLISSISHH
jgi:cation diffusion facilitator CzcD-associated flavoprotein CzcO